VGQRILIDMRKYSWKKEEVEAAVKDSVSYIEVLRKLDVNTSGNNIETLKRKIKEYDIDISHFTFHAKSMSTKKSVYEYLIDGSNIHTFKLKEKLIAEGLKENKCEVCGVSEWMGKPIVCQLHHINGNNRDNRIENLQMLCPNCHSQTENYCGQANKSKEQEKHYCEDCGRELKTKNSRYCLSCSSKRRGKITLEKEDFIEVLKRNEGNRLRASRELNVSETAIRKCCEKFGLPTKSKDLKNFLK